MATQQAKYELLKEQDNFRNNHKCLRICVLVSLCAASSIAVYATWNVIYRQSLNIPPNLLDVPRSWIYRLQFYNEHFDSHNISLHKSLLYKSISHNNQNNTKNIKQIENERIYPSKLGNFIYKPKKHSTDMKLVCYYHMPTYVNKLSVLYPSRIDPHLCTHINVGPAEVNDSRIVINDDLRKLLENINELKIKNENLKILLWVGGADDINFPQMVSTHAHRKLFIQSLKSVLETYRLDGLDLDWEFPSAYSKERQHFSQLLHEIRREYQREHRTYLLSVAVSAVEGIAYFAYDIREINSYADYINIMAYDYHFYSRSQPFVGLNAPLYPRRNEHSLLSTLNINYTAHYWYSQGMAKNKIVIGLPTYGHSYRLVNPFSNHIGSPAEGFGSVGELGFVSYSELCWFRQNNMYVNRVFDVETCSPYLYSGLEWISYEDEKSLECKAQYIKKYGFGGAMIFSLNTDDFASYCEPKIPRKKSVSNETFPLVRKIYSVLFDGMK
uniref:Putative catalytically inactive chitinase-like lectin n=1 Tax=Tabanus bromius TaxID=304241 RepID=A0A0K8TLZ9_TABBR